MRRVLLIGAALATVLMMTFPASAATSATCGLALSVHNNATCSSTDTLDVSTGTPQLSIEVAIGPLEDHFSGDVQVNLRSTSGLLQRTCAYRATSGLTASCTPDYSEGDWSDPIATCSGIGAGIGEFKVTCSVVPAA